MRAVVFKKYGPADVLELTEVDTPVPAANEVRIRIHAATVSAEDPKLRGFNHPPLLRLPIGLLFGFPRPRLSILGMELEGEIDAVGSRVTRFKPGDPVFGYTGARLGAHAEYKCLSGTAVLALKPDSLTYAEAAAAPDGAMTALVYLRNLARVRPGESVLIHGASGAVGTAAVQLAKHLGAHVTAVCSTRNVELVRSLGAAAVIDYTREDFLARRDAYDVVFDTVHKTSFADVRPVLKARGRFLGTQFGIRELLQRAWTSIAGGKRILGCASNMYWNAADLRELGRLMAEGRLKSILDRCYPLAEAAAAHRHVEQGHKRGSVVLLVGSQGLAGEMGASSAEETC